MPILHGLCTYGVAGRALLKALCDNDATRFKRMECRFSAPVEPGDTLATEIWRDGAGTASFRVTARERDKVVLHNGRFDYRKESQVVESTCLQQPRGVSLRAPHSREPGEVR